MKIRFIQSLGGVDREYTPNEKDKGGKYIWYDFSDYEAVRLIDSDIAVYQNKEDYDKAKANYASLEAQKNQERENADVLANIDSLKAELEDKKDEHKELTTLIKALDAKIKTAEATIK